MHLVSMCSSVIMNLYENETAEMLTFNLCCLTFFFDGVNGFSLEKPIKHFVIEFIKRFQTGILCTVALISLFRCWSPPAPTVLSFFHTRLLFVL